METRGPQDSEGRAEALGESNVIRLPRDWLGPREELVPFGFDPQPAHTAGLDPALALHPSDFWGEDSAAIQHALPAPPSPAGTELRLPRVPLRAALLVAAAVALAAIVGVGAIGLGLTGSSHPASGASSAFEFGSLAVLMPPLLAGEAAKASSHRAVIRVRAGSAARHVRRTRPAKAESRSPSPSPQRYAPITTSSLPPETPSTTSVSTGAGGGSPAEGGAGSTVGAGAGSSAGTGDEGSSGAGTTTHRSAQTGPVGPGAPFGPGHLG